MEGGRPESKEVGMEEIERRRQQHDSMSTARPMLEKTEIVSEKSMEYELDTQ